MQTITSVVVGMISVKLVGGVFNASMCQWKKVF